MELTPCAEREGFEPPVPLGTAVFKTAVIDHSTTFPIVLLVGIIFYSANFSAKKFHFSAFWRELRRPNVNIIPFLVPFSK